MVAISPIRSDRLLSWKKMAKLNNESKAIGIKIVSRELPGYLYRGMMKCVY